MQRGEDERPYDGIAFAAGLAVCAAACLLVPRLVGGSDYAWYYVGVLLGGIALGGAFTEAAKLTQREALDDFGPGIALFALAAGMFLFVDRVDLGSPWVGVAKGVGLFFGAMAILGVSRGVGRALDPKARNDRGERRSRPSLSAAVIVAAIGLATAVVNLVGALAK